MRSFFVFIMVVFAGFVSAQSNQLETVSAPVIGSFTVDAFGGPGCSGAVSSNHWCFWPRGLSGVPHYMAGHDATSFAGRDDTYAYDMNLSGSAANENDQDQGKPVYSVMNGKVVSVKESIGEVLIESIDLPEKRYASYLHMCYDLDEHGNVIPLVPSQFDADPSTPEFDPGKVILKGEKIAEVWDKGSEGQRHLHFSWYKKEGGVYKSMEVDFEEITVHDVVNPMVLNWGNKVCAGRIDNPTAVRVYFDIPDGYQVNSDALSQVSKVRNLELSFDGNIVFSMLEVPTTGYGSQHYFEFIPSGSNLVGYGEQYDISFEVHNADLFIPAGTDPAIIPQMQLTGDVFRVKQDEFLLFADEASFQFVDITGDNIYSEKVDLITSLGLMRPVANQQIGTNSNGTPMWDWKFDPNFQITRGIAAKLIADLAGKLGVWDISHVHYFDFSIGVFEDIPPSHPYYGYIQELRHLGAISRVDYFNADQTVTLGQFLKIVRNALFEVTGLSMSSEPEQYKYIGVYPTTNTIKCSDPSLIADIEYFLDVLSPILRYDVTQEFKWQEPIVLLNANDGLHRIDGDAPVTKAQAAWIMGMAFEIVYEHINGVHYQPLAPQTSGKPNDLSGQNAQKSLDDFSTYSIMGDYFFFDLDDQSNAPGEYTVNINETRYAGEIEEFCYPTTTDSDGDPLYFRWQIDDGEIYQQTQGQFNDMSVVYPDVTEPTDVHMIVSVQDSKAKIATAYVTITVLPETTTPTTQISNLTATNIEFDNLVTSWTLGSGDFALVTCTPCDKLVAEPVDGVEYQSDGDFSQAPTIGGSFTRVVETIDDDGQWVTGLESGQCYRFRAYSYNGTGTHTKYLRQGAPEVTATTNDLDEWSLDFSWSPIPALAGSGVDFDDAIYPSGAVQTNWYFTGATTDSITDNSNATGIVFPSPGTYEVTARALLFDGVTWLETTKSIDIIDPATAAPDFYFSDATLSDIEVHEGSEVIVDWTIANAGYSDGRVSYVDYWLSTDPVIDGSDYTYHDDVYPAGFQDFNGGQAFSLTRALDIPTNIATGQYYILLEIGAHAGTDGLDETNTANNTIAIPLTISDNLPDLVLQNITPNDDDLASGEKVTVGFEVANIGGPASNLSAPVRVFLSDDTTLSPDDGAFSTAHNLTVGTSAHPEFGFLSPGDIYTHWVVTNPALPSGNYYILLVIDRGVQGYSDNTVPEADEDNVYAIPITVTNPNAPTVQASDLELTSKTATSVTLDWTPGDGDGAVVFASSLEEFIVLPMDEEDYTADADWALAGSTILPGYATSTLTRCVYDDNTSTVTVTGLATDQTWSFSVYEYNEVSGDKDYLQQDAPTLVTHIGGTTSNDWMNCYESNNSILRPEAMAAHHVGSDTIFIGLENGVLLRSFDGGESYNYYHVSEAGVTGTICTNGNTVFAGAYDAAESDDVLYVSDDFGDTWETVVIDPANPINAVYDIHFSDSQHGFMTVKQANGDGYIYTTGDGGTTWQISYTKVETRFRHFTQHDSTVCVSSNKGDILRTDDFGAEWTPVVTDLTNNHVLGAFDLINASTGLLVERDSIYRTTDMGSTWGGVATLSQAQWQDDLDMASSQVGWFASGLGSFRTTTDGGQTWSNVSLPFSATANSVTAVSDTLAYTAGSHILRLQVGCVTLDTFYLDNDGDGFGTASQSMQACTAPAGYVSSAGDCDDNDATTYPGAFESCDGGDDCDPSTTIELRVVYLDGDGDGYGLYTDTIHACLPPPAGYAEIPGDCDDTDASIHPDADELCDGIDSNCNGMFDEPYEVFYADNDGDGYGDGTSILDCTVPAGYFAESSLINPYLDCDDTDATIYTGAQELFDGVDNNCNGQIDEGLGIWFVHDSMRVVEPNEQFGIGYHLPNDGSYDLEVRHQNQPIPIPDTSGVINVTITKPGIFNFYLRKDGVHMQVITVSVGECDHQGYKDGTVYLPSVSVDSTEGNFHAPVTSTSWYDFTSLIDERHYIPTDTFAYETRVRSDASDGGAAPEVVTFRIVFTGGTIQVRFAPAAENRYVAVQNKHELYVNSAGNNLISHLNQWAVVRIEKVGDTFNWYLDDVLRHSYTMAESDMGELLGAYHTMAGNGRFDWIRVYDAADSIVYREEFNLACCGDELYYMDSDGDGYSDAYSLTVDTCTNVPGYVTADQLIEIGTDCNDLDSLVNPGMQELPDGLDNDCNGLIDEGLSGMWLADPAMAHIVPGDTVDIIYDLPDDGSTYKLVPRFQNAHIPLPDTSGTVSVVLNNTGTYPVYLHDDGVAIQALTIAVGECEHQAEKAGIIYPGDVCIDTTAGNFYAPVPPGGYVHVNTIAPADIPLPLDTSRMEIRYRASTADGISGNENVTIRWVSEYSMEQIRLGPSTPLTYVSVANVETNFVQQNVSGLSTYQEVWVVVEIEIIGSVVNFYVDGVLKKSVPATGEFGLWRGINTTIEGNGRLDYIRLYDAADNLVYDENFDSVDPCQPPPLMPQVPTTGKAEQQLQERDVEEISSLDPDLGRLILSPNPTSGVVRVQMNAAAPMQRLRLMDALGRELVSYDLTGQSLDLLIDFNQLYGVINGVYLIEVQTEQGRVVERLIIQR